MRPKRNSKPGFTLIEMLVALTIIGILTALILPAVQSARESSRRLKCASNLKQIGIALAAYEQAAGAYPPRIGYSPHVMLLPWLEQKPLYDSVNFDPMPLEAMLNFENHHVTISTTVVDTFLCPSTPLRSMPGSGAFTSYGGNAGVHFHKDGDNGIFGTRTTMATKVSDGLSNTAVFSEYETLPGSVHESRWNRVQFLIEPRTLGERSSLDEFFKRCSEADVRSVKFQWHSRGSNWIQAGIEKTFYYHSLPPNRQHCTVWYLTQKGTWPAGSVHSGKTQTVFADGHVRAVKDSVDTAVWRAIGSRNGAESFSESEY